MKKGQGEFQEIIQTKIKATIYVYDKNVTKLEDLFKESKDSWGISEEELVIGEVEEVAESMGIRLYRNLIINDMFKSDNKAQFLTSLGRLVKVMRYELNIIK